MYSELPEPEDGSTVLVRYTTTKDVVAYTRNDRVSLMLGGRSKDPEWVASEPIEARKLAARGSVDSAMSDVRSWKYLMSLREKGLASVDVIAAVWV